MVSHPIWLYCYRFESYPDYFLNNKNNETKQKRPQRRDGSHRYDDTAHSDSNINHLNDYI